MKIVYFAPLDIQVARVDPQCIVYFCEALHLIGVPVELIAMRIRVMEFEKQTENPLDLYRLQTHFPVRLISTGLKQGRTSGSEWVRLWSFGREALRQLRQAPPDQKMVFYIKNYTLGWLFWLLKQYWPQKLMILFEAHLLPHNALHRFVLGHMDGIVANTHALARDLGKIYPQKPIIGTHQGVNLRLYDQLRLSKSQSRQKLKLPVDKPLAVYTGKIYWGYPEVEYLLQTARLLPQVQFLLVGGRADHVARFRQQIAEENLPNVHFTGFVPPSAVQDYQVAADILLLYYPSGMQLNPYRSPGKIFEYMAAGRPIILADYPVLHEILAEEDAVYVLPDQPYLLAKSIQETLAAPKMLDILGQRALKRVEAFTWEIRAQQIKDFISALIIK